MKSHTKLAFITILSLLSVSSHADELPEWYNLPNEGKDCKRLHSFDRTEEDRNCGKAAYSLYSCDVNGTKASPTIYLLVGRYVTDSEGSCEPVYAVEKVIAAD